MLPFGYWIIVTLLPSQWLLVWCSTLRVLPGPLHTTFMDKLKAWARQR